MEQENLQKDYDNFIALYALKPEERVTQKLQSINMFTKLYGIIYTKYHQGEMKFTTTMIYNILGYNKSTIRLALDEYTNLGILRKLKKGRNQDVIYIAEPTIAQQLLTKENMEIVKQTLKI